MAVDRRPAPAKSIEWSFFATSSWKNAASIATVTRPKGRLM